MSDLVPQGIPSGTILAFAGPVTPPGYLWCNGASLSRAQYPALFAAIGTNWGSADANSFNLPETQGMFLRGLDMGAANDPDRSTRTAVKPGGATSNNVGSLQGHAFQTHYHEIETGTLAGSAYRFNVPAADQQKALTGQATNLTAVNRAASGAKSQPTANETRPINVSVQFMIKI